MVISLAGTPLSPVAAGWRAASSSKIVLCSHVVGKLAMVREKVTSVRIRCDGNHAGGCVSAGVNS